jgi:hypothetical protein
VLRKWFRATLGSRDASRISKRDTEAADSKSVGEGYIRLVARLARSITLHDRSLPLTLALKPEKNRKN